MFGIKSRKRIKELEKELSKLTKMNNDIVSTNESILNEIFECRMQCKELESENILLKSKLSRKRNNPK